MDLDEMTLEEAAKAAAGNWKHFDSFCWHRGTDLPDPEKWTIVYTHNRDSGLLDQSNAATIEAELDTFSKGKNPDVVPEHDHHWACGWVDGFSIRVFRRGRITKAFRAYHALAQRLADYSVLDETRLLRTGIRSDRRQLPQCRLEGQERVRIAEGLGNRSLPLVFRQRLRRRRE